MDRIGTTPRHRPSGPGPEADVCFHDFTAPRIDGTLQDLSDYRGQVILAVNTATQCAFTPQLRALQSLQEEFAEQPFTVLGFPSDQFHQDPGTDEDTWEVCTSTYEVTFPLFSKIQVNGPSAHPLWSWMSRQKGGVLGGRIAWNFTKFLIDADGRVRRRYAPPVPPVRIARQIREELGLT